MTPALAVTIGSGKTNDVGRTVGLDHDDPIGALIDALEKIPPDSHEAWIAPCEYKGCDRENDNFLRGSGVLMDADYLDEKGKRAPLPNAIFDAVMFAAREGRIRANALYRSERGMRFIVLFAEPVEDVNLWRRAALGAHALIKEDLSALGLWNKAGGFQYDTEVGGHGLTPAAMMFTNRTTVYDKKDPAKVVSRRDWPARVVSKQLYDAGELASHGPPPGESKRPATFDGPVYEPGRHDHLKSEIARLSALGYRGERLFALGWAINLADCIPPKDEAEVRALCAYFDKKDRANPQPGNQKIPRSDAAPPPVRMRTDLGNAERLVDRHGEDLRHVPGWGLLAWDGHRWARDLSREVVRRAKETVRSIYREAENEPDPDRRKELAKHAAASEAAPRIAAMIELAKSDARIQGKTEDFDRDPMFFNVANGTIDLTSGALRPQRREDYCTKLAPVEYDPDAKAPRWEMFLEEITARPSGDGKPNKELIGFLQRAVGYSATGHVKERVVIICWGSGKNGKSVFLRALAQALGEYAHQAEPQLLLARKNADGPRNGIAQLFGTRYCVAIETGEGKRLNEAFVKWITGGDRLRGSFLFRDSFEFSPTHTPWLATNYKPAITETARAIWDRIRLVPFVVTFDDSEDKDLLEKLRAEIPGILAWAVRGCLEWQRVGLAPPEEVQTATKEYRAESDELAPFLETRCVLGPNEKVTAKELRAAYLKWCALEGEQPLSAKAVGSRLTELGCKAGKGTPRTWRGIGLAPEHYADPDEGDPPPGRGDAYEDDLGAR